MSFSRSLLYDNENNISGILCIASHNTSFQQEEQQLTEESSGNESSYIRSLEEIPLTNRELEIIKLITEELSNREIADKLFISVRTVETHRKNIMQKLHTKSVIALVHYAAQNGII
jgi:DNA-binding NarL/FixJ family response regulator